MCIKFMTATNIVIKIHEILNLSQEPYNLYKFGNNYQP